MTVEWWAFVVTIIAVICNSFVILPWNNIFGIVSCALWCYYAYEKELTAIFWINTLMGQIYLAGILTYYFT